MDSCDSRDIKDENMHIPDSPDLYRYTGDTLPKWKSENKSLLKKCLT